MFEGSIVALVTPMEANGDVDWDALERLIGWQLEQGTNGIVPMGTTGESATLNVDEHLKVIERTVAVVAKQVPVIAGTGANATWEAIHQTQRAEQLGADACLLVTPYYNRPTQAGLVAHYKALSEAANGPLVLYNVPPRTACDMLPETVAEVAQFDHVVAIKEACGDAERVADIRQLVDDDFVVLSGEDAQTLRMLELGARGTISVTANVLPAAMSEFCRLYLAGDVQRAAVMDADLQRMHAALFIESSPTPTKWALQEMGMIGPGIRLPLLPLSSARHEVLRAELQFAGCLA